MPSKDVPRRPDLASTILVGGVAIYAFLCLPAIGQRGYPPIDPAWVGVTLLWIFPLAISALFDSFWFRQRRVNLVIYLLATAFIFSGTIVTVVPRTISPGEMLLGTLFLFGPLHLLLGFAIEGLMQLCLWPARSFVDPSPDAAEKELPRITLFTWLVGYSLICMAIGFPFAFRSLAFRLERSRGAARAIEDWEARRAVLYGNADSLASTPVVEYRYDPKTGLRHEPRLHDFGFRDAYNAKIAELIATEGIPKWSMRRHVPTEKKLLEMLDSTTMMGIEQFPYDLTPGIVLFRKGEIHRWGSSMSSGDDSLSIGTETAGLIGVGSTAMPVHVAKEGEVVFIRNGQDWVGAFHRSGVYLGAASRH